MTTGKPQLKNPMKINTEASDTKIVWAVHISGSNRLADAYAGKNAKERAQREDHRAERMTEAQFRAKSVGGAIVNFL